MRQGHVALRMGLITCDHGDMASEPHVTLSGDIVGEYVVEDRRPDGELPSSRHLSGDRAGVRRTSRDRRGVCGLGGRVGPFLQRRRGVDAQPITGPARASVSRSTTPRSPRTSSTPRRTLDERAPTSERDELTTEGLAPDHLKACDAEGRDGTRLPGCAKIYIPEPDGTWGMVFQLRIESDGRPFLACLAFGSATPPAPARSALTRSPINEHTSQPPRR